MFDPARDDDAGHRRFYTRLLVIVAVGCLVSLALWPSLSGFEAGSDGQHTCIAIVDALRRDSAGAGAPRNGGRAHPSPPPVSPSGGGPRPAAPPRRGAPPPPPPAPAARTR